MSEQLRQCLHPKAQTGCINMFFPGNNRMFRGGRLIEGGVYFENFEKGGGRLFEGGV